MSGHHVKYGRTISFHFPSNPLFTRRLTFNDIQPMPLTVQLNRQQIKIPHYTTWEELKSLLNLRLLGLAWRLLQVFELLGCCTALVDSCYWLFEMKYRSQLREPNAPAFFLGCSTPEDCTVRCPWRSVIYTSNQRRPATQKDEDLKSTAAVS